ncbi:Hint domain-containing protein [Chelatococcus reniformis]|uniref:Hedgehog/Intein (Hint) domain-containing protein n=1 Tax=Chelatococcus reniformis TaxID=1494448 RepID=A0A916TY98_9HYPH|nr:Hint domain-containing protein [Chelatococcus reniformis]GGC48232.1 hypothetical protein GCM10010994_04230 [Chelatococcus reniformis]
MTIYGPNINGVSYDVTLDTSGAFYDLAVLHEGTTPVHFAHIAAGHILFNDGDIIEIASDPFEVAHYVVPPTVEGTISIIVDLDADNVFHIGGSVLIDIGVDFASSATLDIDGGTATLSETVEVLAGTTVNLTNGGTFGNGDGLLSALANTTIAFGPGGGTFIADAGGALINLSSTRITGFDAGRDHVAFENLVPGAVVTGYSIVTDANGDQIIVGHDEGAEVLRFVIEGGTFPSGSYVTGTGPLGISTDGTTIIVTACFLAGTRVATPAGPVAIETLRAGDLVTTPGGEARPVRWLAMQTVARRSIHANPWAVLPIRIRQGALGDGLPARDLFVSPDHALLIEGCLVQAGALVNGTSVTRHVHAPQSFVYYHVELDDHALVLVEGVPAETFIDHVSRQCFDNWQEAPAPAGPMPEIELPRIKAARQLPRAVRERLAAAEATLETASPVTRAA